MAVSRGYIIFMWLSLQIWMLHGMLMAAGIEPPCTHANKQVALYLTYSFEPNLRDSPATDISIDHHWNSTREMRRYGKNGVFAAQPVGFGDGPGGYLGSQSDGDASRGGLLFSLWDSLRRPGERCAAPSKAPNATWCDHKHSFPLSPNCHRHCLDCGLHPGWHNTTGTQCAVPLILDAGDTIRLRLFQSANRSVFHNPEMGVDYTGSEWTATATNVSSGQQWVLGRMFLEDTFDGIVRFGAFHEHIGCTRCNAFYESEIRTGPFGIEPGNRTVSSIVFNRKNVSCELYDVKISRSSAGVPQAQFRTGPGT